MGRNSDKVYSKQPDHMSADTFADLKIALEDALAYERGERKDLKITRIQVSKPVRTSVRKKTSVKRRS
jgi:hypothetical protein